MPEIMDQLSKALESVLIGAATNAMEKAIRRDVDNQHPHTMQGAKPQMLPPEPATEDPRALLFDPFALIDQLGYRDRPSGLTYQTLREMAKRVPTYAAIEQIRINQVCAFAQPQEDERDPGFVIEMRDPKKTPGRKDIQRMNELTDWTLQTGSAWGPSRDDFRMFLHKLTRDSLELDQSCFEVGLNRKGIPAEFVCLDGASMRLADVPPGAEHHPDPDTIKYVQVYDEIIVAEFPVDILCWGIRNPRSDLRANGYGLCLHPDSRIATDRGLIRIEELAGSKFYVVLGENRYPATAISTGEKPVWTLRLKDNREIKASADHRFYCVGEDGCWRWKRLEELVSGDFIAEDLSVGVYQGTRADVVSPAFGARIAQFLKDHGTVDRRIRGLLENPPRWGVTRNWLANRVEDPELLNDLKWGQVEVIFVEETSEVVEMYDVCVDSEFHGFSVDGVVAHNSELEMLLNVITASLWAFEHNKNFFKNGASAKGLMNFKGSVPDSKLDSFRRMWQMMIAGVGNAHKTPMTSVDEVQWIDLHKNNTDMEFSAWMDWLIKITSATMLMDPAELNFNYGNTGQASQMFQAPAEQKLKQSKDRGLRPLLTYFAKWINTYLIWRLDPNYRLVFRGLDAKGEDQKVDLAKKKATYLMTVDELRAEEDLKPLPDGKGEVILDPTWLQNSQAQDMAGQQMGGEEGMEGEEAVPPPGIPGIDDQAPEGQGEEPDFMEALSGAEKSMSAADRLRASRQRLEKGQLLEGDPLNKAQVTVYEIDL
jgi:hypothetical protein